ncbi:G5 domain-containing protein [Neobacillus niacini]|uniref:G5 domain-containing protein n=1 Tax=Neobacillus niacini TaxID=86668 RepID=UPI00203DD38E|nr:VanW family protein [Neobacillus niacini]MCM3692245.1 VanW family protein [Neobacillus niacini]
MSKYQPFIKLFTVLFMSTAFIFSFSHFGSQAFGKIGNNDGMLSEGTSVGSVNLSGKTENEAIALLEERHVEWVKNAKIELQYSEKVAAFDMNLFYFDATETVLNLKDGQKNLASISIDLLQVEEQINTLFPEVDSKQLELTKLTENLTNTAAQFEDGTFSFHLNKDYLLVKGNDNVISEVIVDLENVSAELSNVINKNPAITIGEESTFSLLEFAKQQKFETSSAINIVATGIYQAVLPTNLTISERNISKALPQYAVLGFEAMVNTAKGIDLVIENPNKVPYTLQLELVNGDFKVTLNGDKLLYKYEISKKDEQVLKPKTIVQYSPLVLPGKTKVESEGVDGKIVKVYRNIYQGSQLLTSKLISEDYYPPVYRVEIMGLEGTQQGTSTTGGTISNGTTNSNGTQTPSASDTNQQISNNDDLWGKLNEEEK